MPRDWQAGDRLYFQGKLSHAFGTIIQRWESHTIIGGPCFEVRFDDWDIPGFISEAMMVNFVKVEQ